MLWKRQSSAAAPRSPPQAGVAANSKIRAELERACQVSGKQLYLPKLSLCGDNGAMIGCQAYYEYLAGRRGDWSLNGYANREIDLDA